MGFMLLVPRCIGYIGSRNQDWEAIHCTPSWLKGPFSRWYRVLWWRFIKPALTFLSENVVHLKNASCSCHFGWTKGSLLNPLLPPTLEDRLGIFILVPWKTSARLAGILMRQSVFIWANWIANSETKAIVLERVFTMRGTNFYNKTECGCVGFFAQKTQEWYIQWEKLSLLWYFYPPKDWRWKLWLISYCSFGLAGEFCAIWSQHAAS